MMQHISLSARAVAAFLIASCALPALAQTYPTKPIRAVMPYSAGSGPDVLLRSLAEKMARDLGQPVVVDNKPGGNGWIGVGEVLRSEADGHTFLMSDTTIMTVHQSLFRRVPFDAKKDFEPVAPLYFSSFFVVVKADSPWNNLSDIVAAARVKEGQLTYGSWGVGSAAHIGSAMLESGTGVKMRHIPFKDIPSVFLAVANGDVDWAFGTPGSIAPLLSAKKIKAVAYSGAQRLPVVPNVGTVAELGGGLSKFELTTWAALYMRTGSPKYSLDRLGASVVKALNEPEIRGRLNASGFTPWFASLSEFVKAEDLDREKYRESIRRLNISLD